MSECGASAIAVFLGPSLPREAATALLAAQYLPPAQFGDVYRLIGSGVRAIVLIDGVFHGRAPVWQRELLCALRSGIRVYGAASMGALRAAELDRYGMVGLGTVYTWYASGELDGDDEVALLHAGPEQGHRPLSLPLVNVRGTLSAAVNRGLITRESAVAMIAHLKALPFWERTAEALWDAPATLSLDPVRRTGLREFIAEAAVDVKGADAALALAEAARREQELPRAPSPVTSLQGPPISKSPYDRFRLLKRGFQSSSDGTLEGSALVEQVLAEPAQRRLMRWTLSARFFLLQWAQDSAFTVPESQLAATATTPPRSPAELRANSLTANEYAALQARQALLNWLAEQPPEQFGISSALQDEALLPEFPESAIVALQAVASRRALARTLPYVAAWCERAGVVPLPGADAELRSRWSLAIASLIARGQPTACEPFLRAVWTIEQGPVYFGYATWSLAAELISELQLRDGAAAVAGRPEGVRR